MEIMIDCIPCLLKQALEASKMATDDSNKQEEIVLEGLKILLNYKNYRNSPDLARQIHLTIKEKTGIKDPYIQVKKRDLEFAKNLRPSLYKFLDSRDDKLYWALKVAAAGNNLDSAIYKETDIKKAIKEELDKSFEISDIDIFTEKLKSAKNILVIGDNTGETVFDKIMIEYLPQINITYAVRSEPIINDVTEKEAYDSNLDEVSTIVSTGCNASGAILEDCSEEFKILFKAADRIISKRQGNYEALSEERGNVFFLLKAKCPMIASRLEVELGSYVFKNNKFKNK